MDIDGYQADRERTFKIIRLSKFFSALAPGHGGMHGFCNAGCRPMRNPGTGQTNWPDRHFNDKEEEAKNTYSVF